jgi:hypothetical protein
MRFGLLAIGKMFFGRKTRSFPINNIPQPLSPKEMGWVRGLWLPFSLIDGATFILEGKNAGR